MNGQDVALVEAATGASAREWGAAERELHAVLKDALGEYRRKKVQQSQQRDGSQSVPGNGTVREGYTDHQAGQALRGFATTGSGTAEQSSARDHHSSTKGSSEPSRKRARVDSARGKLDEGSQRSSGVRLNDEQ